METPKTKFDWKTLKQGSSLTWRSLDLAWQSSRGLVALIASLTLLAALFPIAIAYVGKLIVDSVVAGSVPETTHWVVAEFGLIALQAVSQRSLFLARTLLGNRLALDTSVVVLEKSLGLELRQFEDPDTYDKLNRAWRESSSRPAHMVNDTLQFLQNILVLISYAALLFSYNVWAALAMLVASIPATVAETRFSKTAFRMQNWRSSERRKMSYLEYMLANDNYAKEVKALGIGPLLLERYRNQATTFYHEDKHLTFKRSFWGYVLSLLSISAFYGAYLSMAVGTARGLLTLGTMTLYVIAFRQGQQAFQSCLAAIGSVYEHTLYMSNLFEFLAMPRPSTPPREKIQPREVLKKGIVFDKVGFRYPGREEMTLKDISFEVPEGSSVALVGYNGAGKTTLIKLLCRLYEPSTGWIFLDGKELGEWDREKLWKRIGVVFQDFNRYHFSFGDNVGIGQKEFMNDEARIRKATESGGAEEVLKGLNQGTQTQLGRWFTDGVELSGGQWQKVALSRGFMREDSDILILDEPTAALDAEAEYKVFERFRKLTEGKTSFIISHRFPTARLADKIIFLEEGHISEMGTHTELLKKEGTYSKLFHLQAEGYR